MLRNHQLKHRSFQECFSVRTNGSSALAAEDTEPSVTEEDFSGGQKRSGIRLTKFSPDSPTAAPSDDSGQLAAASVTEEAAQISAKSADNDFSESIPQTDTADETVYFPVGTEYVKSDSDLPKADNKHTLPDTAGIIYEVAEELYCKEKTAAEIEALCQPPFQKVFDRKQIEKLDLRAEEHTRRLLADNLELTEPEGTDSHLKESQPLSVANAFLLQALLCIPLLNIAAALLMSFGAKVNSNIRACCRAFLVWSVLLMTIALGYFTVSYFSDPAHQIVLDKFVSLFQPE